MIKTKEPFTYYVRWFKVEIDDKQDTLELHNTKDWTCIILGWAIGKGLTIKEAQDFVRHIAENTELGY